MQNHSKINIAIDGYSSCGKGTVAKNLANILGYKFIDSGAMYRAVTLYAINHGFNSENIVGIAEKLDDLEIEFEFNEETKRNEVLLNYVNVEKKIRTLEVAQLVSEVAKISEVRRFLVKMQQKIGENKGVVMDGRDIGTVVFPHAELKIFMTASPEVRANRRLKELLESGIKTTYELVLENIKKRDNIDSTREDSPLIKTDDYKVLDNSDMSRETQNEIVLDWALRAIEKNR